MAKLPKKMSRKRSPPISPGFAIMADRQGNQKFIFAEEPTAEILGPGAIDPQKAAMLIGQRSRIMQINYGDVTNNEFRAEFEGRDGLEKYRKMEEEDTVKKVLNYIFAGIRNQEYYIDYASEDPVDLEAAAFVADQLGLDGLQANKYGFQRLLKTYENCLKYGTSYGEIVLELAGGKAVLDKFIPIHPLNVEKINYDARGGPKSVSIEGQIAGEKGKQFKKDIPVQKLVIFINEDEGDLRGQSILRAAYIPYRIKREMLKLINKGYERFLLGIPKITAPAGVTETHPSWALAEQIAMKFAMNPRSGVVLPDGWELEVLTAASSMPDALPYVQMMNSAIAEAMGVEWSTLGKDGNGSGGYGHSNNLMSASERVIRMYVDNFCAHVNTYMIPKLVVQNFPQLKQYPVLRYSTVTHIDPSPKLNAIGMLVNAAMKTGSGGSGDNGEGTPAGEVKNSGNKKPVKFADTSAPGQGTSPVAGAKDAGASKSGFDEGEFAKIVAALPTDVREMLGFERDRRKELMAQFRLSRQTAYAVKE